MHHGVGEARQPSLLSPVAADFYVYHREKNFRTSQYEKSFNTDLSKGIVTEATKNRREQGEGGGHLTV